MKPLLTAQKIPGVRTIIGVTSAKGGVGKSLIATSLAITLAKLGKKVGIIDADISCPDVFKMLGINQKIIPTNDGKLIPVEKWGVRTISMAALSTTEDEAIVWRGPMLSRIIQQLLKETVWRELDILIIDFPTGTSDIVITTMQQFIVDGLIVVSTPQSIALSDTRRCLNMAALIEVPVIGLVENMRGEFFGEGGISRVAEMYRLPLLGSIPIRKQISSLCDQGQPPVMHLEELEMVFVKMSRAVLERVPV